MSKLMNFHRVKSLYIESRYTETLKKIIKYLERNAQFNWKIVRDPVNCDVALYFDLVESKSMEIVGGLHVLKILVRQEPKLVIPRNYESYFVDKFDHVIDIGKFKEDLFVNINWPQDLSINPKISQSKKDKFVMVNSNLLSLEKNEHYSLRRTVIAKIQSVDLYGYQWNNSNLNKVLTIFKELRKYLRKIHKVRISGLKYYFKNFDNYLGEIENKREVMSLYKYSIVIENSSDYVSEKLFDALLSGCIPIYVGPNLTNFNLPQKLYIQAEPNFEDIERKMVLAQEMDYSEWLDTVGVWLADIGTNRAWSQEFFFSKVLTSINRVHQ